LVDGKRVTLGRDPFVGGGSDYKFSEYLMSHLHSLQIYNMADITYCSSFNILGTHDWILATDLNLEGDLTLEWEYFIITLQKNGVSLSEMTDSLCWT